MRTALLLPFLSLAIAAPLELNERTGNHFDYGFKNINIQVGNRPEFLIGNMDAGPLKDKLASCSEGPFKKSEFVIAHRGAPLQFPEHSKESYIAAARQGAGTIECDVTFTKDKKLVCRHSQCDLHTTTDILQRPELAAKCTTPFTPAKNGTSAKANCCTSDITLAEFQTLCAKMDGTPNPNATSLSEYLKTPVFRTDLFATCGKLMTHVESIKLIDSYRLDFTPELKTPSVAMPFNGYTQAQFAQDVINDYKNAGISSSRVWPQSFLIDDIYYWIKAEPKFGKQAVYLDARVDLPALYPAAVASLPTLAEQGVKIVAPAMFALTKLDANNTIVPSEYAIAAKQAGLKIITWSFERSGFLNKGGDYYYQYISKVINNDGDMYTVLDVLYKKVGIFKMFSDWPATVTYYANCMGIK
ncbi:glycerophosphoryl diester phosphodiesterase [Bisporella sp. PMI_857]|nr:glycerophosphoryl diester phosphodiesterase [Bisporella sp. PMI_857]